MNGELQTYEYSKIEMNFRKYGVKCGGCKKPIVPKKGQLKAPRIRALGKDFHISCFKCEASILTLFKAVRYEVRSRMKYVKSMKCEVSV